VFDITSCTNNTCKKTRQFFFLVLARASEVGSLVIRSAQGHPLPLQSPGSFSVRRKSDGQSARYSCYRQLRHCLPSGAENSRRCNSSLPNPLVSPFDYCCYSTQIEIQELGHWCWALDKMLVAEQ